MPSRYLREKTVASDFGQTFDCLQTGVHRCLTIKTAALRRPPRRLYLNVVQPETLRILLLDFPFTSVELLLSTFLNHDLLFFHSDYFMCRTIEHKECFLASHLAEVTMFRHLSRSGYNRKSCLCREPLHRNFLHNTPPRLRIPLPVCRFALIKVCRVLSGGFSPTSLRMSRRDLQN